MADADVTITDSSTVVRKLDTRTVGAGADEHRQVVVLGDPSLAAGVQSVDITGRAAVTSLIERCAVTAVGELQGVTSATVCPTVTASFVRFKAQFDNVGSVYLGLTGVTRADGVTDTTTGLQLFAGDDTGWIPATNLNTFYRIADNAGDDLTFMVLA